MKNMTTEGRYSIQRLVLSLRIFGDSDGISMVIGGVHRERSEAMEEAEA